MHGQGGGLLYAPIQVLFGVEFHQAAAASQLFIILTSLSAMLVFRRAQCVDWAAALVLELGAATGGYLGGMIAYRFSPRAMLTMLGVVVLGAAVSLMGRWQPRPHRSAGGFTLLYWARDRGGQSYSVNLLLGIPLSFAIGLVSGMTGVAGGFLKTPMMVLLFGMPIDVAFGTTAFMITLTAAGGLLGHLHGGQFEWGPAAFLGVFVVVGAQIGPRITLRTSRDVMRKRFSRLLLAVSLALFYVAWTR
jgi:uncharacterized membrane protein YfcA